MKGFNSACGVEDNTILQNIRVYETWQATPLITVLTQLVCLYDTQAEKSHFILLTGQQGMALGQFDITSFISTDELSYFLGVMNF